MTAITAFAAPAQPRLRLTARGRTVLTVLLATPLVIAGLMFGWGAGGAVAGQDPASDTFTYVSVDAGQSLWSIAESIAPEAETADVVADLLALNQLQTAELQPGQRLAIPAQYAAE